MSLVSRCVAGGGLRLPFVRVPHLFPGQVKEGAKLYSGVIAWLTRMIYGRAVLILRSVIQAALCASLHLSLTPPHTARSTSPLTSAVEQQKHCYFSFRKRRHRRSYCGSLSEPQGGRRRTPAEHRVRETPRRDVRCGRGTAAAE